MPEEILTGRIVDWNWDRGFGYLEHGEARIFLHIREFSERHKPPEIGDRIRFVMGADRQGRPCAKQAVHVNDGGRFELGDALVLLLLLAAPAVALYRIGGGGGLKLGGAWCAAISGITYVVYALDKKNARTAGQREPENLLHLMELIGGWPGALVAQHRLRHKSAKTGYQFAFWLIVGLHQFVAIDALRGWPVLRHLLNQIAAPR